MVFIRKPPFQTSRMLNTLLRARDNHHDYRYLMTHHCSSCSTLRTREVVLHLQTRKQVERLKMSLSSMECLPSILKASGSIPITAWWHTLVIPAFDRQRQEDQEFEFARDPASEKGRTGERKGSRSKRKSEEGPERRAEHFSITDSRSLSHRILYL